jgi:hypothetical protein
MKIAVKISDKAQFVSLPNDLIEKYHFENEAELVLQSNGILIKSVDNIREGWAEAFKKDAAYTENDWSNIHLVKEHDDLEWTW